jgi:hypothetical protein
MRNIFLFFFLISFGLSLAQTELLNQNFNNGNLSSWTFIDGDMAAPYNDPMVSNLSSSFHLVEDYDSLNIGDSIMAANSWFNDTIAANNFIITPALTFTNNGNYLNFQAKSLDGSYPEALQVFCSQYLEKDSILNSMLFFDTIALPNLWTNFRVKLEGITLNTQLYIAFRHYSNNRYIIALDNVNVITNDLTNQEKFIPDSFSIYPNPSNGYINIESRIDNENINIYNSIGKTVWSGIIGHKVLIYLPKGIYFLENKKETIKIIIQ